MRAARTTFETFHAMHDEFFVIAPTWDILSATALHATGYKAIATTSVGAGFAQGVTSEEVVTKDEMLALVASICNAVDIPVSVDMESGYADTEEGLADNVRQLIEAGAVGLNLEDNSDKPGSPLVAPDAHADRIRIIRRVAEQEGVRLFINARTDAFWIKDGVPAEEKAAESIERGNHYRKAGADGVFVSGPKIPESVIAQLASGIDAPLNLLMQPDWPSLAELRRRGVIRLSLGSWHARAVYGFMQTALERLREEENLDLLREYAKPTAQVDKAIYAARPKR
jgi:2-methylisocitrate lyase-like PEP mutase family enzyme